MFFALEAHSFPPSLANGNEKMYHSTKSDIIHCIEREAEAVSHGATETNTQQQHDCVVQDGSQLVHQLDARGTGTFEQFTQRLFLKHLQVELRKVSRLDIVWEVTGRFGQDPIRPQFLAESSLISWTFRPRKMNDSAKK